MIAGLPMYDWPERRGETDALWTRLRDALRAKGFDAPDALTRTDDVLGLWLSQNLLIGETCTQPLETVLRGRVRYVATPVHEAPGCGSGTYRSVLVARGPGNDVPPPQAPEARLPDRLEGPLAANEPGSMSGYVALARDCKEVGIAMPAPVVWTGSHRASIRAVADGAAAVAAIDCVTWRIARAHEPAAAVRVIGWTAERPGLPLITNATMTDNDVERLRTAVASVLPVVVIETAKER